MGGQFAEADRAARPVREGIPSVGARRKLVYALVSLEFARSIAHRVPVPPYRTPDLVTRYARELAEGTDPTDVRADRWIPG